MTENDFAEAFRLCRPLAEQGNPAAQSSLGTMYAGGHSVPQNDAEAVAWSERGPSKATLWGKMSLGEMYMGGRGVAQNDAEAVAWFRKAAEQGDAAGEAQLGLMYEQGGGVATDFVEAAKWYRKGAEQGDTFTQGVLGEMYQEGRVVPQDYVLAHMWLNLAARDGSEDFKEKARQVSCKNDPRPDRRSAAARAGVEAYEIETPQARIDRPVDKRRASHPLPQAAFN